MNSDNLLDALKTNMLMLEAQARGAFLAYQDKLLDSVKRNYRFKHGDIITVQWDDGNEDYQFDKIDFSHYRSLNIVIFATRLLKSGKLSRHGSSPIWSPQTGELSHDSMFVTLKCRRTAR